MYGDLKALYIKNNTWVMGVGAIFILLYNTITNYNCMGGLCLPPHTFSPRIALVSQLEIQR